MNKEIKDLIRVVEEENLRRKENAQYAGQPYNAEERALENIQYYLMGASGQIPPDWKKYEKFLDPEYHKYLELKEKFGSK